MSVNLLTGNSPKKKGDATISLKRSQQFTCLCYIVGFSLHHKEYVTENRYCPPTTEQPKVFYL